VADSQVNRIGTAQAEQMTDAVAAVVTVVGMICIAWIGALITNNVSLILRQFVMHVSCQRHPVTQDRHDKPCD